jgi:cathepsin L
MLFAAASATVVPLSALPSYTFEQFLSDFKPAYAPSEMVLRKKIFTAELARVLAHNAANLSWKEGINKFSVMTDKEKRAFYGYNKNAHKATGLQLKSSLPEGMVLKPVSSLPETVDWRNKGVMTAVKDQGHCGSCWAFASTAVIESHVALASGLLFDLSVQQIAMCAPNTEHCGGTGGCEGSTAELAFTYLSGNRGIYQQYQYGYDSYYGMDYKCTLPKERAVADIDGYVRLPTNNYTALMNAVATVGPVAINVDASTFHAYTSGVFAGCDAKALDINHVVVLAGYGIDATTGLKYWLVRNSWSPVYGEAGYIRVLRTDNDDSQCAIDSTPQDGVACDGDTAPIPVCGMCGVIYDSSYPTKARAL